ncbi:phosphatidylinositol transfer protein 3-like isoform X2 [Oryza brachyantha]|uniref:CRAL-TRIO domain-containing protein n=1 Tax=Oryza brachyantha TaxID=4533 RepID=J3M5D2_ORYBR|nr:phosphatidylinositol transfer protein 3-like isoform X2 [Oryza brachyantha]
MSFLLKTRSESNQPRSPSSEELKEKIVEVRELLGSLTEEMPEFLSDATIRRFLRARNWSTEQATKSLQETVKWRRQYRPETICWEDIAEKEYEGRRAYITDYLDAKGRCVLVTKPTIKAKVSGKEQIKYFVYLLESLAMNSEDEQEEHVTWLLDLRGWAISSTPLSTSRESMHIVQNYYPGMIAVAILSNTPRIFESFWKILKHFLEAKMNEKVKFVYTNNPESHKIVSEMFDMDKLETAFGGRNSLTTDMDSYAERMRRSDLARGALSKQPHINVVTGHN